MPKGAFAVLAVLVLLGTGAIIFPFVLPPDRPQLVEANINECRGLYKKSSAITYGTYIDQPPGEIFFVMGDGISQKIAAGYEAACKSGKPLRIRYGKAKWNFGGGPMVRGMQGVDGTEYFGPADFSASSDAQGDYMSIAAGVFLYLLAIMGYRGAKKKAAENAAAAAAARVAARKR